MYRSFRIIISGTKTIVRKKKKRRGKEKKRKKKNSRNLKMLSIV
jgi:hypothetical protein